jgi:hypothetical protein
MTGCPFQVVDKFTKNLRPCLIKCGSNAVCRRHLQRHEVAELRLEVSRLGQQLFNCEAQIAMLRAEIQQKATPPAVTPPPPPHPPRRTSSLPTDPVIALFNEIKGTTLKRALSTILPPSVPQGPNRTIYEAQLQCSSYEGEAGGGMLLCTPFHTIHEARLHFKQA